LSVRLLLVPHAPTAWNVENRFQGWANTPLSEVGKQQAALLARRLLREPIDICYASNLRRAWETATAIAGSRSLLVLADPQLREMHFGVWEGLTYADICHEDAQGVAAWEANPMEVAPPGGETLAQVARRVTVSLAAIRNKHQGRGQTVLVVAHRGSLRVLLCLLLGLPPTKQWQFLLTPASLSELELHREGVILNFLNDTHHLGETAHAG
jgi:broad specificity phosphatase PhoE